MRVKRILYLGLDPSHYKHCGKLTHCPLIQTIPRPASNPAVFSSLSLIDRYTHLIISSKTTIPILFDYIPREQWIDKAFIAVGQATTHVLQSCGISKIFTAKTETAEGIIDLIKNTIPTNAYLFWPHSSRARSLIKDFLHTQKFMYKECALYDTVTHLPTSQPDLAEFDEIIFTSSSSVDAFIEIFGEFPSNAQLIPIGPITEDYLSKKRKSLSVKGQLF